MYTITWTTKCGDLGTISTPSMTTATDVYQAMGAAGFAVRAWYKGRNRMIILKL